MASRSNRVAMGEISNVGGGNRMGLRAKDANVPAQKPARGMAKQKGVTSLKSLQGAHKPLVSENEHPRKLNPWRSNLRASHPSRLIKMSKWRLKFLEHLLDSPPRTSFNSISMILTARTLMIPSWLWITSTRSMNTRESWKEPNLSRRPTWTEGVVPFCQRCVVSWSSGWSS